MRILERCISAWPMPETEAQINGLRSAFSADITRPFELRPSFPLGSSPDSFGPSPPAQSIASQPEPYPSHQGPPQVIIPSNHAYMNQQMNPMQQSSYLATPPVSAVSDSKPQSPLYDLNTMPPMTAGNFYHQHPNISPHEAPQWNPTPIIDQFNTAFAIPASALAPPAFTSSPPVHMSSSHHGNYNIQNTPSPPYPAATTFPPSQNHQAYYAEMQQQQQQQRQAQQRQQQQMAYMDGGHTGIMSGQQQPQQQPHPQMQQQAPGAAAAAHFGQPPPESVYVTPKQWQQSVASVYEGGLKRRWDYMQGHGGVDQPVVKRR